MTEINITEPDAAPTHRISATYDPTDTARDRQKVRIRCRVADCVAGTIEGSPAAWIRGFVETVIEHHALDVTPPTASDTDDLSDGDFYWPVADQVPPPESIA